VKTLCAEKPPLVYGCQRSPIAQLVEHSTVNRNVAGSSPARGASFNQWLSLASPGAYMRRGSTGVPMMQKTAQKSEHDRLSLLRNPPCLGRLDWRATMQREQRRDPRHLPNVEERRKTNEPLKQPADKRPLDSATQVERRDAHRLNKQAPRALHSERGFRKPSGVHRSAI
jgi:hypothetical protein